jgi:hypothetical protein
VCKKTESGALCQWSASASLVHAVLVLIARADLLHDGITSASTPTGRPILVLLLCSSTITGVWTGASVLARLVTVVHTIALLITRRDPVRGRHHGGHGEHCEQHSKEHRGKGEAFCVCLHVVTSIEFIARSKR